VGDQGIGVAILALSENLPWGTFAGGLLQGYPQTAQFCNVDFVRIAGGFLALDEPVQVKGGDLAAIEVAAFQMLP
jgi:hypothetical protein